MPIDSELFYQLKDALMIDFLKDDVDTIKLNLLNPLHEDDEKLDRKLLKAYSRILKYYGENDDRT
jgi:hypothetical protein